MDYLRDRAAIRSAPNKLKVLRWCVNADKIYIWTFPNKRSLKQNLWHQKRSHRPVCNTFDVMPFIRHKPSIKERAWFMGFFNAGCFIFARDWNRSMYPVFDLNIDRDIFVNYDPFFVYFFCKSSKIVRQKNKIS